MVDEMARCFVSPDVGCWHCAGWEPTGRANAHPLINSAIPIALQRRRSKPMGFASAQPIRPDGAIKAAALNAAATQMNAPIAAAMPNAESKAGP
jgi:hypothetical protein